jgi:geranylgeranyl pyrophosphate synthase
VTPKPLTSETSVATAAVSSSAVDALLRALAADGVCALDPTVPAAVWEKALAGPAAEFLARSGKQLRASFVRAGWALAGSSPTNGSLHASSPYAKEPLFPERLSLIVEVLHAGSLIVDDVQDGSMERRGAPAVHALVGTPLAINLGSWMYFWALAEIAELALPPHIELRLHRVASSTLARCHQGQALDLSVRIADLEMAQIPGVVAATTRLKTAALCRFATELGALAAGASSEQLVAIGRFGEAAGTALQMLDDLGSLTSPARRAKGREDLRDGRPTWPWAWLVTHRPFAWSRFAQMERALAAAETIDANADDLADALAAEIGDIGRAEIRSSIARAVDDLQAALGPSEALSTIVSELERMERSYG